MKWWNSSRCRWWWKRMQWKNKKFNSL